MPRHNDMRRCVHMGCVGTQTFHAYPRPPGWGVSSGEGGHVAFQDRTQPAWQCDYDPEHFDPEAADGHLALGMVALGSLASFDPAWDGAVARPLKAAAAQLSTDLGYRAG